MSHLPDPTASLPPPINPLLTAYDRFQRETPLVSRCILQASAAFYLLSYVVSLKFALGNIPYFCIYRLEVYRILMAPFMCDSLLNLVFAYFIITDHVKRLEYSMGSTAFAALFVTMNLVVNVGHIVMCFMLSSLFSKDWLMVSAAGLWIVLLPLLAAECLQAPSGSQRPLFCWAVPAIYFPCILGGLIGILTGQIPLYAWATAVGYAWTKVPQLQDRLSVSSSRCQQWEETFLSDWTNRPGFIVGHAATGSDAWMNSSFDGSSSTTSSSLFRRLTGAGTDGTDNSEGTTPSSTTEGFLSGHGRTLGGPTMRRPTNNNVDARTARLKVLEGRGGTTSHQAVDGKRSADNKKGSDEAV